MIDDKKKLKEYIFSQIDFRNVHTILDLGCGNCDDLNLLNMLYPKNKFTLYGIDRIDCQNLTNIRYIKHDLNETLPFKDTMFDLIYSHNVLECIRDKKSFLKEIFRLLKPEGQVVCSHTDWDTQLIDGDNKELIRKIVRAYAEWKQPWMDELDSWLGRRVWGIFIGSKLFQGDVKSYTIIDTSFVEGNYCFNMIHSFKELVTNKQLLNSEYDEFYDGISSYQAQNKFFYAISNFIYYGRKTKRSR